MRGAFRIKGDRFKDSGTFESREATVLRVCYDSKMVQALEGPGTHLSRLCHPAPAAPYGLAGHNISVDSRSVRHPDMLSLFKRPLHQAQ